MNNERHNSVEQVGKAYSKAYSGNRISGILIATQDLSERDFKTLAMEVENRYKYLPLRQDWIDTRNSLGLSADTGGGSSCVYCNKTGYLDACLRADDRKDALGNAWPKIKNYKCLCEAGRRLEIGDQFERDMIKEYRVFKYNEPY